MSETIALARLAIARSQKPAVFLLAALLVGMTIGLATEVMFGDPQGKRQIYVTVFLAWSFLPAGLASLVLFDFSSGNSINLPESNCSHWVLRLPIRSWKIAVVPLALKTAWIVALWTAFSIFLNTFFGEQIPIVVPCLVFSSIAIWLMAIAWRPFRYPWLRFVAIALAACFTYGNVIVYFAAPTFRVEQWTSAIEWTCAIIATIGWATSLWAAHAAIRLARTSPDGFFSDTEAGLGRRLLGRNDRAVAAAVVDRVRTHGSPVQALVAYDVSRNRDRMVRILVLGVAPTILVSVFFVPLHPAAIAMLITGFVVLAGIAVSGHPIGDESGSSTLSVFLARLPLGNATIAWTRFAVLMGMMLAVYSLVGIVFAGWTMWPSNREVWWQWAADLAARLDRRGQVAETGWRVSAMILIATTTAWVGVVGGWAWPTASGRDRISITVWVGLIITLLIGLMMFTTWFARQPDWETAMVGMQRMRSWITFAIVTMLVSKGVASAVITHQLVRHRIASVGGVAKVVLLWSVITGSVATSLAMLNPTTQISTLHCVGFALMWVPLAGVLVLPIAVRWNRHR